MSPLSRKKWVLLFVIGFMGIYIYFCCKLIENSRVVHRKPIYYNLSGQLPLNDYIRKGNRDLSVANLISIGIGAFREIPEYLDKGCENMRPINMNEPRVSVIITFLNESRSTLLRSITSILKRSPVNLLKEIIVIDDCNEDESIGNDLNFLPLVRIFRNNRHEGVMKSRNIGAGLTKGDFIVFLDSHCEVNSAWLEPLLSRIMANPGLAVSPVIDSIDSNTFQYKKTVDYFKGGFNWNLQLELIPLSPKEHKNQQKTSTSFLTPTFSSGIFMMSKEWFLTLNGFSTDLKGWGGESLEMAVKIWLCGGQIEIVPCSRIGHIFKGSNPFSHPPENHLMLLRNSKIIAESWLDEYKQFFYAQNPDAKEISIPSLDHIRKIKQQLQCRPFSWYMQNVFKELKVPNSEYVAFGELKNGPKCLAAISMKLFLKDCGYYNNNEWFLHEKTGALSTNGGCLTANKKGALVRLCRNKPNQVWSRRGGKLIHKATGLCLESFVQESVGLSGCRLGAPSQLFSFSMELQKL